LESEQRQAVLNELDYMEKELVKLPYDNAVGHEEFAAPLWQQFVLVTQRVFQQYWRTPSYIWAKLFLAITSSLFIGFVFFKANLSMQGLQNQMFALFMFLVVFNPVLQQTLPSFVQQRDLYEVRERPSKTFSWKAFILSQIVAEIPWNIAIGTLAFFCFYYPAGFYRNAEPTNQVNQRGAYAWFFSSLFFVFIGTFGQLCIAPLELADSAGNLASLCFTLCLTFCGVLVGPSALPGFWIFMYRVSPFTYFIDGFLSNALANTDVTCSSEELRVLAPPQGLTCEEYLGPYIQAAGTGYLVSNSSTTECQLCPMSSTNAFLTSISLHYKFRWRNVGIFIAFIVINMIGAVLFYWLARVPKKSSRVKNERGPKEVKEKNNADDEKIENSSENV
jgi:ATP-binding cassette subfamily G (WHITE) protein 2 (PDR)